MTTRISGVKIPDSKMAREATAFLRDTASEMLFSHSMRVYLWAALAGQRDGLKFDPELLYVASMFHDVGLLDRFHESPLRFEVDGANAARDFLRSHGIPEDEVRNVWLAIALHTSPGIPQHLDPEIALVHTGAVVDVVGRGYEQFSDAEREAVLAAYPRDHHFNHAIIDTFYEALKRRPQTTYGTLNADYLAYKDPKFQRGDVCSMILSSRWSESSK
jgi:HD superfamily phosphodiesterase